jgi:Protein of unknown function (DUF3727)/Protein of unknown function (DUF1292)
MAKSNKGRENLGMDEEADLPTVTLKDEAGRSLLCYVEKSLEVEGKDYVLLLPVDSPIEIFAWEPDEEDDEEETLVDVEEEELDEIFSTARAVLAEQDLTLNRTALTLTASGDIPLATEEDIITLDLGEDEGADMDSEQFQLLANFYHEEQEYAVCTPLDPLLFFARLTPEGQPELLSPEEFQAVRSQLEDQLFDEME